MTAAAYARCLLGVVRREALRFVHQRGPLPLITSCCPAWTDFMEKKHWDFIDNFSTAKSPQQMLGVLAKTYYAQQAGIDPAKLVVTADEVDWASEVFALALKD